MKPIVITLCGSMRYQELMTKLAERLELEQGYAVIGVLPHVLSRALTSAEKERLGKLHRAKIERSDAIYVVNADGYIGESVRAEIEFAQSLGKEILYLQPPNQSAV